MNRSGRRGSEAGAGERRRSSWARGAGSEGARHSRPNPTDRSAVAGGGEGRLLGRGFARCPPDILEACSRSSVLPEFLGALTANESGGNPGAARFEPAVYRHLKGV